MSRTLLAVFATGLFALPAFAQDTGAGTPKPAPKAGEKDQAKPARPKPLSIGLARFSGAYADLAEGGADFAAILMGGGGKPKPFYELVEQLREFGARKDRKQLLLDLTGSFSMNAVQVMEMERCLRDLRKSGKKLYAYLEMAGSVQMQLAAQCDKILLADMGVIEMPSVAMTVTFMKDAFDLLGIKMDVVRCGDFKGAVEPYMLSRMSKHLRKHYVAMLGKINDDVVRRIATGRGLATAKVRELQARRMITAKQALAAGLVDDLVPWEGAAKAMARVHGGKPLVFKNAIVKKKRKSVNFFTLMTNLLNPRKKGAAKIDGGLVVLHLSGGIVDGTAASPGSIVSGPTVKTIRQLLRNDNCKAVVVRVNSPGGSATASEAILLALRELAKQKPVVFSMGRVAASGGYYVTCVGRPIFAEAGTITGSIGVFGMKPSVGALMRRVGIHDEIIGLDEGADMASLDKLWTPEQRKTMQNFVNEIYDRFTGHVSASRSMPVSAVLKIAGGRVWSGEQAVDNGLVDKIGGLDDAIRMAAAEAKLGDDFETTHLPEPMNPMDALMQSLVGVKAAFPNSTWQLIARKPGLANALRIVVDAFTSPRPTKVWAMLPEGLIIR